jgi:hypothetical protein
MTHPGGEQEHLTEVGKGASSSAIRWGETFLIWSLVALGGLGLWASSADPIFGGPEGETVALTLFASFVALGVAATILIWCWPGVWKRWFQEVPPEGGSRLEAAKMATAIGFWVLAVAAIVGMIASQWTPVAMGLLGGVLLFARLVIELALHHRLGRRPTSSRR